MVPRPLLTRLCAEPRLAWASLLAALAALDEADAAALEPALGRWSDEERTFPPELWEAGGEVPPAADYLLLTELWG
jgi:hypothetical protein